MISLPSVFILKNFLALNDSSLNIIKPRGYICIVFQTNVMQKQTETKQNKKPGDAHNAACVRCKCDGPEEERREGPVFVRGQWSVVEMLLVEIK